jgi:hypothetical protein
VRAVEQAVHLNEIFRLTLTLVNLSASAKDLVLRVEKPPASRDHLMRKASFSVSYEPLSASTASGGRRTPRSARRMKTFMDLRRMAINELTGDKEGRPTLENAFSHSLDEDDEDEDEEDEDEEEEDLQVTLPDDTARRAPSASRRDKSGEGSIYILNTVVPLG